MSVLVAKDCKFNILSVKYNRYISKLEGEKINKNNNSFMDYLITN